MKKKSFEKAVTATIVFFLILSLMVRYGIYVLAVVAIYIAVRLMKDEG